MNWSDPFLRTSLPTGRTTIGSIQALDRLVQPIVHKSIFDEDLLVFYCFFDWFLPGLVEFSPSSMICRLSSRGEKFEKSTKSKSYSLATSFIYLKSETVELLECLNSWFRAGVFTEDDLHAILGTMAEGAVEALEDLDEALDY